MTAPAQLDPAARGTTLADLAGELYELLASGHDALAFNVNARGPAVTALSSDGRRHLVRRVAEGLEWERAREIVDGAERDRRFNPWVLQKHMIGRYSVAPAAPGWVQWVALDVDAHPRCGSSELEAMREARVRADRVMGCIWRALRCSAERHPLVMRSPGGGYHVWIPLTRDPSSQNPEHTWPAAVARAWFERHLIAAGLELKPGSLEIFPAGRCLRAPCGRGMTLLQATQPDDPDHLGFVPWPGTSAARVDWAGERAELSSPVRRVVPLVRAFTEQWRAQRRSVADWLGRPEACWDPTWGFLGWRGDTGISSDDEPRAIRGGAALRRIAGAPADEKRNASASTESSAHPKNQTMSPGAIGAGMGACSEQGGRRGGSGSSSPDRKDQEIRSPSAALDDQPPASAGGPLVRGRAFKVKVRRLLEHGIVEVSTRHDAVLTLAFYWACTCGLGELGALARLKAWCEAFGHQGSRLASRPRVFSATCLREARHYLEHYAPRWRFQARGDGGGLATLTPADQVVISEVDPEVRSEVAALLAWLAGRADSTGRIGEPIQIATGLLARLCGDRRVERDGKRRRATAIALGELERLGVLTLASNYRVGVIGRTWCCWYRFGSGELPRQLCLPLSQWDELGGDVAAPAGEVLKLAPGGPGGRAGEVLELAPGGPGGRAGEVLELAPGGAAEVLELAPGGPGGRAGEVLELAEAAPADVSPIGELAIAKVEALILAQRTVPEGLLRVLADGTRGLPRVQLVAAPEVAQPTARPAARAPWFVRAYQGRSRLVTPGRLQAAATVLVPFPDVEERRRMTRAQRIAWGGGAAPPSSPPSSPAAPPSSPPSSPAAPPSSPPRAQLVAELAADVAAEALREVPLDLLEVLATAWGGFRRRGPSS